MEAMLFLMRWWTSLSRISFSASCRLISSISVQVPNHLLIAPCSSSTRHAADEPPFINSIKTAQAAFERISAVTFYRVLPCIPRPLLVVGMERFVPAMTIAFLQRQSRVGHPLLVEVNIPAVGPGDPDDLRHGLGQQAKFVFAFFQRLFGIMTVGDVVYHAHRTGDPVGSVRDARIFRRRSEPRRSACARPGARSPSLSTPA